MLRGASFTALYGTNAAQGFRIGFANPLQMLCINAVGYQNISTPATSSGRLITPTFESIDGKGYDIQNWIVSGATDGNQATIQVLGPDGKWTGGDPVGNFFYWWPADGEYPAGWFDGAGNDIGTVKLNPGDGVFFSTLNSGISIQSAGQVSSSAQVAIPDGNGAILGNVTPVPCKLSQVTLTGTPVTTENLVTIQILDPATGKWTGGDPVGNFFYWWPADGEYPAGWFDGAGNEVEDVDIPAGGAFYISSQVSGVKLQFPKVLGE